MSAIPSAVPPLLFTTPQLAERLDALPASELDVLPFGVIRMDRRGMVLAYNRFESEQAGLRPERVVGRNFFSQIGVCTNNRLVADRYTAAPDGELDEELDYVFTFRLRHVPVRLRMLSARGSDQQYLLVRPR